jgi:hypothetical protein
MTGGIAPPFLTSALDGDEWSAYALAALLLGMGPPCTHWIGGWEGPTVSLDTMENRKIFCPC